ncbi:hypothetical protein [Vibrio cholerae]|uniref:hypothetical protein n=1 Tax=Vibrio cholerae TaxID=666 RepID=UPI00353093E1
MKTLPLSNELFICDYQIKSEQPNISATSHNEKTLAISRNIQYFHGKITLFAINKKATRLLQAFLESLRGQQETFELELPDLEPLENLVGTPTLRADYPAGVSRISLDSFSGTIHAGDYFRLSNDNKLYRALEDGTANNSFAISPSLRKAHKAQDKATFQGCTLVVRLTDDAYTMQAHKGMTSVMKATITFKEAL